MRLYSPLPSCERAKSVYVKREWRGVEIEVGEMLYALVRLTKPLVCIETGTLIGDSAEWIGKGLLANGMGRLITCDTDPARIEPARQRLCDLPVEVRWCSGYDLLSSHVKMDFVHIDSGSTPERQRELMLLDKTNINPMGIVAYHDACADCVPIYEPFVEKNDWPHLVFPTLVGMAVFQRPEA